MFTEESRKKAKEAQETGNYEFVYVELGDTWEPHEHNNGGFKLNWGCKYIGFGELVFYKDKDNILQCDNEGMSVQFVEKALAHFVRSAALLDT